MRATGATRNSITVAWSGNGEFSRYILQIRHPILGWTTAYSGYKTEAEVSGLKAGESFQFRVKSVSDECEAAWSGFLYAATKEEPIPASHLFRAVENGNATAAKRIITARPSILDVPNRFSQRPVETAIARNDVHMANVLLAHGADLSTGEIGSWRTPLMIAAYCGHVEAVQFLVEKGSSWEDRDRNGLTALHYAADNSHLNIVRFAVETGADVTAKDSFGWSPAMRAVTLKAAPDVVNFLLDNGGDANEADGRGQTLLMQAVQSGEPEVVRLILAKGGDIRLRNAYGHSACDMARCSTSQEMRKLCPLLETDSDREDRERKSRRNATKPLSLSSATFR